MKVLKEDYSDSRLQDVCVFCGAKSESGDHIPSKFLLDDPFPPNLSKVPACIRCNNGYSLDETYVGCFVDAVLTGSAQPTTEMRPKVRAALAHDPKLVSLIERAKKVSEHSVAWEPDLKRFNRVIYKLAQGHAAFEYGSPLLEPPEFLFVQPLISMNQQELKEYEFPQPSVLWPEVGSRAMQRIAAGWTGSTDQWAIVQPDRYRFLVTLQDQLVVRIVLSEYLACMVGW